MARFPHYKTNIIALGRLLAEARLDPKKCSELMNSPQDVLAGIGLPENVTQLMNFKVIDGTSKNAVALPYKLNKEKVQNQDSEYLHSIYEMFENRKLKCSSLTKEKSLN